MFVKLTSGFAGRALVSRNLVLQDFWKTGSKSCKLEVTFAIHLEDSERYHNIALKISKSAYNEPHEAIAYSFYNIGVLKAKQKNFSKAEELLEMALNMYIDVYGEDHPDVQETREELEKIHSLIADELAE